MKNKLIYCSMLLLLVFSALSQAAQVYRWVDGNGKVHFSDQPGGLNSLTIDVKPIPRHQRIDEQTSTAQAKPPESAKVSNAAVAQPQDNPKTAKVNNKNCEISKDNLKRNQDISRMYRLDENGERAFLSDAEREAVLDKSRQQIQKWCG